MSAVNSGRKQSAETIEKRSQSLKAARADPDHNARWNEAVFAGIRRWHEDPGNAKEFAERSSERMRRRHTDPEWQKVRNERSSRTMKANWERYRDDFTAKAVERYARELEIGIGLNSEDAKRRKAEAAKWIMTKAQEALRAETDYEIVFADVQERLRRELPYDGPKEGSDYFEYLQKLGREVVNSPECRAIADEFMASAIPRFAKEWKALRASRPS